MLVIEGNEDDYSHLLDDDEVLLNLDMPEITERDRIPDDHNPHFCAKALGRFPFPIILLCLIPLIAGALIAVAVVFHPFPSFDDPVAGFETRGTYISAASRTQLRINDEKDGVRITNVNSTALVKKMADFSGLDWRVVKPFISGIFGADDLVKAKKRRTRSTAKFCRLDQASLHIVFESRSSASLFSLDNLKSMCRLENEIAAIPNKYLDRLGSCGFQSLANSIQALYDVQCNSLSAKEFNSMKTLIEDCAPYYHRHSLRAECANEICYGVPKKCTKSNAIYNILHYFADIEFSKGSGKLAKLTYSMAIWSSYFNHGQELFEKYFSKPYVDGDVKLVAVKLDSGTKFDLFTTYMMKDFIFFGIAFALICSVMLLYLMSVTLTLATIINVAMSFGVAYFVYHVVLRIEFFPFMNVLAMLLLIAVGADDVFVFYDSFEHSQRQYGEIRTDVLMEKAFNHAALSVFVTSFTTASSFFANYVSNITSIKCFGIFAGVAILANLIFMVTWTPTVIVAIEWVERKCSCSRPQCWQTFRQSMQKASVRIYGEWLPKIIEKLRYFWLVLFLLVGVGSFVVVFYKPKLQLPKSKDFQLFPVSNYMEKYDIDIVSHFHFEVESTKNNFMPISYTWGFIAQDSGNWMNPDSKTRLLRNTAFNISMAETQKALNDFCHDVVKQPFIRNTTRVDRRVKPSLCPLDRFGRILKKACDVWSNHIIFGRFLQTCCRQGSVTKFKPPFLPDVMEICIPVASILPAAAYKLHQNMTMFDEFKIGTLGTFIYDADSNVIGLTYTDFMSTIRFSPNYGVMNDFYSKIRSHLNHSLSTTPPLRHGFVTSYGNFEFYDLQHSISTGTYYSIALSLAVATVVMFLTSLNLLITLYAIFTITLAIASTVACIVFLGWHLNIIESISISLAVGLSIDFTIHYGVAYKLSTHVEPALRVKESFSRVGSAVAMAALTTFLAGTAMLPCHILAYKKLGIFLMIVMSVSWLYATFFFQSLCRVVGPRGQFCQIVLPCSNTKSLEPQTLRMARNQGNDNASVDSFMITF